MDVEFERAVRQRTMFMANDQPVAGPTPIETFAAKHGHAAVRNYVKIVSALKYSEDFDDSERVVAALEALGVVRAPSTLPLLESVVLDTGVHVRWKARDVLEAWPGFDIVGLYGPMLLDERFDDLDHAYALGGLRESEDLRAIPFLERRLAGEKSPERRENLKNLIKLIRNPDDCLLVEQQASNRRPGGSWCRYKCTSPSLYTKEVDGECPKMALKVEARRYYDELEPGLTWPR